MQASLSPCQIPMLPQPLSSHSMMISNSISTTCYTQLTKSPSRSPSKAALLRPTPQRLARHATAPEPRGYTPHPMRNKRKASFHDGSPEIAERPAKRLKTDQPAVEHQDMVTLHESTSHRASQAPSPPVVHTSPPPPPAFALAPPAQLPPQALPQPPSPPPQFPPYEPPKREWYKLPEPRPVGSPEQRSAQGRLDEARDYLPFTPSWLREKNGMHEDALHRWKLAQYDVSLHPRLLERPTRPRLPSLLSGARRVASPPATSTPSMLAWSNPAIALPHPMPECDPFRLVAIQSSALRRKHLIYDNSQPPTTYSARLARWTLFPRDKPMPGFDLWRACVLLAFGVGAGPILRTLGTRLAWLKHRGLWMELDDDAETEVQTEVLSPRALTPEPEASPSGGATSTSTSAVPKGHELRRQPSSAFFEVGEGGDIVMSPP